MDVSGINFFIGLTILNPSAKIATGSHNSYEHHLTPCPLPHFVAEGETEVVVAPEVRYVSHPAIFP
jgi:hypothetical protein